MMTKHTSSDKEPSRSAAGQERDHGLDVQIPMATLKTCSQLRNGEGLKLLGTMSAHNPDCVENKVEMSASCNNDVLCVGLQGGDLDGIFTSMCERWRCVITGYQQITETTESRPPLNRISTSPETVKPTYSTATSQPQNKESTVFTQGGSQLFSDTEQFSSDSAILVSEEVTNLQSVPKDSGEEEHGNNTAKRKCKQRTKLKRQKSVASKSEVPIVPKKVKKRDFQRKSAKVQKKNGNAHNKISAEVKSEPCSDSSANKTAKELQSSTSSKQLWADICTQISQIPTSESPSDDNMIVCLICSGITIKNQKSFNQHLHKCHNASLEQYKDLLELDNSDEQSTLIDIYSKQNNTNTCKRIKRNYKCPSCGKVLTRFDFLSNHLVKVHKNDADYLALIDKVEKMKNLSKSAPSIQISCDYCSQTKLGIRSLQQHLKLAHSQEKDLKEKLQDHRKRYQELYLQFRRDNYRRSVQKGKRYLCHHCGESFPFHSSRYRHQKYSCLENPNRIKLLACQYCDRRFTSEEKLRTHRAQHVEEDFKYVCDICGTVRRTKAGMYDHKREKHSTITPKHTCPHCDKSFHSRERFNMHVTVHSNARTVQCELCGNNFKTKSAVQKHQKEVHFNKYRYHCSTCGHGMAKKAYLDSHKCGRVRRPQALADTTQPAPQPCQPQVTQLSKEASLTSKLTAYLFDQSDNPPSDSNKESPVTLHTLQQHPDPLSLSTDPPTRYLVTHPHHQGGTTHQVAPGAQQEVYVTELGTQPGVSQPGMSQYSTDLPLTILNISQASSVGLLSQLHYASSHQ